MSDEPMRVGIVGASATRGWARTAHVPAIRSMHDQFRLVAVATRNAETARLAGDEYGVTAYGDPTDLICDEDVDVILVAVKVPHHAELVTAALQAGKDVYCEWPFGRTSDEASTLAAQARAGGRRVIVGLQGRFAPQIAQARRLVADGTLGRITSVIAYTGLHLAYGGTVPDEYA
jgi:predicted dehydrogenase